MGAFVLVFLYYVDDKPVEIRSGWDSEALCVQEGKRWESLLIDGDFRGVAKTFLWTCLRD